MHQVLYRKYRPQVFEDVCGQSHITDVLRFEAERDRVSHAYLFCGSRGTGKTTCAKILAKAVNCEALQNGSPCCKCRSCLDIDGGMTTDVVEMDAASNNSVDDIRRLCEEVVYTPSMLKKKVYIIDEVHMLSQGAFNALLKTIEEPPSHIVFILATTELHKIPATIVSRCQRFDFRRIDMNVISDRLEYIASKEGIDLTREAAQLIARQAQGGMRDAIGLFELCGAGGADVNGERVKNVLGLSGYDAAASVMENVKKGNMGELFGMIAEVTSSSKDVAVFWQEIISFVRDMLVSKYSGDAAAYLDLTEVEAQLLREVSAKFTLAELIYYCKILDEGSATMARTPQNKRLTAEMCLLRMCRPELETTGEAISARLSKLEDKISLISMGASVALAVAAEAPVKEKEETQETVKNEEKSVAPQYEEEIKQTAGIQRVRDISEAVSRLEGLNQGLVQFLRESEVYTSADGKELTVCATGFGSVMMDRPEAKDSLSEAFALAKITDGRATVKIVKKGAAVVTGSIADELGNML
ncbi:MAG: DNA polymerase III subunit gamma/tau [Clostridia bacterium]|nr:DNA polymerase III subunit gamma/tau [Clostridia bacterium]